MLIGITGFDWQDKGLQCSPVSSKYFEVTVNYACLIALAHRISENINAVIAAVGKDFVIVNGLFRQSINLSLILFAKEPV